MELRRSVCMETIDDWSVSLKGQAISIKMMNQFWSLRSCVARQRQVLGNCLLFCSVCFKSVYL